MSNRHPSAAVGAVVMVAFPRECLHDHFLGIRDVKLQINSRDRRSLFLRVAASFNIAFERTVNQCGPRLAAARSSWPAAQLGRPASRFSHRGIIVHGV